MTDRDKVAELLIENEDFVDELDIILALDDESGNGVDWETAEEEGVSSGAWGRFIQKNIIVEVDGEEDRFTVDDLESAKEAIEEYNKQSQLTGWTRKDKIAGFIGINFILFYISPTLRNLVGGTMDILLSPLVSVMPFYIVILLLGLITGIFSTIIQYKIVDRELLDDLREKMQEYRKQSDAGAMGTSDDETEDDDEVPDNPFDQMDEKQQRMMQLQKTVILEQTRPMAWILPVSIPVFMWIFWKSNSGLLAPAEQVLIMPFLGQIHVAGVAAGPFAAWIVWYFVCSLVSTQLVRKFTNLQVT